MTVQTTFNKQEYTGNGVTTTFDFSFPFFVKDDIIVTQIDTSGVEKELAIGANYSISGVPFQWWNNGSSIVLNYPLPNQYRLIVERIVSPTQETSLRNLGRYDASAIEKEFDKLTMICQQITGNYGDFLSKNKSGTKWITEGLPFDYVSSQSGAFTNLSSNIAQISLLHANLGSNLNANGLRVLNLPPPSDLREPLRKGDAIEQGAGPSFQYVDEKILTDLFSAIGYVFLGLWTENEDVPAKEGRVNGYAKWLASEGKIIAPKSEEAFTTGDTFQSDLNNGYWEFPIPIEVSTVTEMKSRTDILVGMTVKTKGYYKIGDGGHGDYLAGIGSTGDGFVDHNVGNLTLKLQHNGSINVEQAGVIAGQDYGINDTAIAALIDYVKTKFYAYIQFSEGSYGFSKIDCKNVQYIKIIGMGINKTILNCMVNTLEPFFDLGQRVNDSSNSNINFGDVGDFSINSYVPSEIGFSMSQFNRSTLRKIAVTGFSTNYDISYSWIVDAGKLLSVNHRAIGFKFHGGNINAFNVEQMSASSNAAASTNYLIEDVHSLNVSTVNCEGSSAYGLTLSNVKGFKVGMWHHEGISIMRTIPSGLPLSPGGSFSIDAMHGFSIKGNIFAIDAASPIGSISISSACLEMTDYEIQNNLNIRLAAKTLKMDGVTVESIDDQSVITGIELFEYVRTNSTYTNINGEDPRKNRTKSVQVTANNMTDSGIGVNTRSSYMIYISYRSTATDTVSAQYRLDVHDAYNSFTATKISGGDEILSPTIINGNIGVGSKYTLTLNVTMQKI